MLPLYRCKRCGAEFTAGTPLKKTQVTDIFRILNEAPFLRANSPIKHFEKHNCHGQPIVTGIGQLVGFTSSEFVA